MIDVTSKYERHHQYNNEHLIDEGVYKPTSIQLPKSNVIEARPYVKSEEVSG